MTRVALFGLAASAVVVTVVQGHVWWMVAYTGIVGGLAFMLAGVD
jgi:hypothetical protein